MSSLLSKMRRGSFKGVPFDTFSFTRKTEKKNTEHKYANSKKRYIEERGVQLEDFSITFAIFGTGEDYVSKRDALRTALASEGIGVLVLPLEGEYNVKCVDFSDSQDFTDKIGKCEFSATFKTCEAKNETGNPVKVKSKRITLNNKIRALQASLANAVNNNASITKLMSYSSVAGKLSDLTGQMSQYVGNVQDGSLFGTALNVFKSSMPDLMANPSSIGSRIASVFNALESSVYNGNTLFAIATSLFNFGDNDPVIVQNTPERIEMARNTQVLNTQIQTNAVILATSAVSEIDFNNEEELNSASSIINEQIKKILASDALKNNELAGMSEVSYTLKETQVDFNEVVDEKQAVTPKIKTVKVSQTSLKMLAYQFYGNVDNIEALIDLNGITDPKSVSGEVRIFTDA